MQRDLNIQQCKICTYKIQLIFQQRVLAALLGGIYNTKTSIIVFQEYIYPWSLLHCGQPDRPFRSDTYESQENAGPTPSYLPPTSLYTASHQSDTLVLQVMLYSFLYHDTQYLLQFFRHTKNEVHTYISCLLESISTIYIFICYRSFFLNLFYLAAHLQARNFNATHLA